MRVFLYILTAVVAWMGLRHFISMLTGQDQCGVLKQGQRLCHFASLSILWTSCVFSLYDHSFWPLVVGVVLEYQLRKAIVWSGKRKSTSKEK